MIIDTKIKNFFVTDKLAYENWGVKGQGQNYYVTGFISTDEVDLYNEVVTPDAMKSMVDQLRKGNIKLDVEHETFSGQADIPIGRIIDAQMVEEKGNTKIWIKASINKAHSKFNEVWKSIKEGFLDAFSIAYKPLSSIKKMVDGVEVNLLKAIELLNVAITGNPVNKGSKMVDSFMKSVQTENLMEETNMSEEQTPVAKEEQPIEKAPEEVKEEVKEEPKEEVKEEVKVPEVTKEDVAEVVKETTEAVKDEVKEEIKEGVKEEIKEAVDDALKAPLDAIKSLRKDIAELKSQLEKPILKAVSDSPQVEMKNAKAMDFI